MSELGLQGLLGSERVLDHRIEPVTAAELLDLGLPADTADAYDAAPP